MEQAATIRVAGNLRAEVSRAGYSRNEFRKLMGWSPASTTRRLDGVQPMTIDMLTEIAAKLDVPLSTLLAGVVEAEPAGRPS
jgi:transcriptional regulator with XRE-family HTH domain